MKKITLICVLLVAYAISFAQSKVKIDAESDYYFETKDYFSAIYFYNMSLEKDSVNFDKWYNLAESYRFTHQYSKGILAYQKVLSSNQWSQYPNTLLWLGVLYKNIGNYDLAIQCLKQFTDSNNNPSSYWYRKALMEWKGAQLAISLKNQENIQIKPLGEHINSSSSDFAPFPLGDSLLFFSSMLKDDGLSEELMLGHRGQLMSSKNGELAELYKLFNDVNFHTTNITFNALGNRAYFNKCKQINNDLNCQIYSSQFENGLWSKAVLMDQRFNAYSSNNSQPQWAEWKGVEGLFISSDRVGGFGNLDIWFIPFKGSPINLGNGINTAGREVTPFYQAEEQTLYFSSDFHPGIGGLDIFKTIWDSGWSLVSNVGLPLNSSANDLYYISRSDSINTGYLSSNRLGSQHISSESCCNDIYSFEKTEECVCIKVDSLSELMRLNLPLSLYFHNDEPNPNTRDSITSLSYSDAYSSFISLKGEYIMRFSSVLAGRAKNEAETQMREFFQQSVYGGYQQLQLLAQQLEEVLSLDARVELNLKGYTSPLTASDYNNLLAKRRISSVENYLNEYNSGVLLDYIDSGQLKIRELPLGETQVKIGVSDNPLDRRNSVYSIKAAKERRIEILSILVEIN